MYTCISNMHEHVGMHAYRNRTHSNSSIHRACPHCKIRLNPNVYRNQSLPTYILGTNMLAISQIWANNSTHPCLLITDKYLTRWKRWHSLPFQMFVEAFKTGRSDLVVACCLAFYRNISHSHMTFEPNTFSGHFSPQPACIQLFACLCPCLSNYNVINLLLWPINKTAR